MTKIHWKLLEKRTYEEQKELLEIVEYFPPVVMKMELAEWLEDKLRNR